MSRVFFRVLRQGKGSAGRRSTNGGVHRVARAQVRCRRKSPPDIGLVATAPGLRGHMVATRKKEKAKRFLPFIRWRQGLERLPGAAPTKRISGRDSARYPAGAPRTSTYCRDCVKACKEKARQGGLFQRAQTADQIANCSRSWSAIHFGGLPRPVQV